MKTVVEQVAALVKKTAVASVGNNKMKKMKWCF